LDIAAIMHEIDSVEQRVIDIFSDVLESPGEIVGDSDFFLSGGNSLLAGKVIGRLRTDFEVRVTLRELFNAATPRQLAEVVARSGAKAAVQPE
jgi:acyl carrier protein